MEQQASSSKVENVPENVKPTAEMIARQLQQLQLANNVLDMGSSVPRSESQARKRDYKFWNTQPVPKITEVIEEFVNEPIDPNTDVEKVSKTPSPLPDGFIWVSVDINNDQEVRNFVEKHIFIFLSCFLIYFSVIAFRSLYIIV